MPKNDKVSLAESKLVPIGKATLIIEMEVEAENVETFIQEWSGLRDRLIEQAGIKSAIMTIPEGIRQLELSTY